MNSRETDKSYESLVPFQGGAIPAVAVYCSDGRFESQVHDFLHNGLQLGRCDLLVVPGGPACLAGHFHAYREEQGVVEQLRFLVRAHNLQRVVLIAHEDCAFYTKLLEVSELQLESQQRDDIRKAVQEVRSMSAGIQVDTYIARIGDEGKICFEPFGA